LNNANIDLIENNDGFSTYIMTFNTPVDISANSNIVTVDYKKNSEETVHLNIVNVNFKDIDNEEYLLSTQ
jgi:hypothetical protein